MFQMERFRLVLAVLEGCMDVQSVVRGMSLIRKLYLGKQDGAFVAAARNSKVEITEFTSKSMAIEEAL
jgi:hypothetical protein